MHIKKDFWKAKYVQQIIAYSEHSKNTSFWLNDFFQNATDALSKYLLEVL